MNVSMPRQAGHSRKLLLMVALEAYASMIKSQVNNEDQLGGKLDSGDKASLLNASKEVLTWLSDTGAATSLEEIEEQKIKLENIAHSITSKLYKQQGGGGSSD